MFSVKMFAHRITRRPRAVSASLNHTTTMDIEDDGRMADASLSPGGGDINRERAVSAVILILPFCAAVNYTRLQRTLKFRAFLCGHPDAHNPSTRRYHFQPVISHGGGRVLTDFVSSLTLVKETKEAHGNSRPLL